MGGITFTSKLEFVRNCKCYGFSAIALVDSQYDLAELGLDPNIVQVGSILIPSYDAINASIDGDIPRFNALYCEQLSHRDCDEFLSLIAYALYQGKNIVIYVGEEQTIVPYIDLLADYIRNTFGITIGVDSDMGFIDFNYFDFWLSKFYLYSFITYADFLKLYTIGKPLLPDVINKLIMDFPLADFVNMQVIPVEEWNNMYCNEVRKAHGELISLYKRG